MRKKRWISSLLTLGLSAALLLQTPVFAEAENTQTEAAATDAITTNAISGWPQGADIPSEAAIVMEDSTNTILYAKNMDEALFPGSSVKIMTCLLALENSQLSDEVTMTPTGVSGVTDGGASIVAQVDEVFTMEQCLYAIMVASANDIALQVAEHVGGSVEGFVDMMNARAKELGCTNTVFTNPTGLPDENQHTTAHDMALIMQAAMSNESFQPIASASTYTIPATNKSGGDRNLSGKYTMAQPSAPDYYNGCLGGKEGFTEASGSTLVCAAQRNDMKLICVILKGASGQTVSQAASILDYGFQNFTFLTPDEDEFNLISISKMLVPAGTSMEDLRSEEEQEGDEIHRTYYFNETPVGTAVYEVPQEQDNAAVIQGEQNMQEAKAYSDSKTQIPYAVIGGVGALLLLLLIFGMVKIIKS